MATYEEYFVGIHPIIKAENPTWTVKEISTEIGKRWSLQNMRIGQFAENVCVMYSSRKILIDPCGKPDELKSYLESYKSKHGSEKFLNLVESIQLCK